MNIKRNFISVGTALVFCAFGLYQLMTLTNILNANNRNNGAGLFFVGTMIFIVMMVAMKYTFKLNNVLEANPLLKYAGAAISTAVFIIIAFVLRVNMKDVLAFNLSREGLVIVDMLLCYAIARFLNHYGDVIM